MSITRSKTFFKNKIGNILPNDKTKLRFTKTNDSSKLVRKPSNISLNKKQLSEKDIIKIQNVIEKFPMGYFEKINPFLKSSENIEKSTNFVEENKVEAVRESEVVLNFESKERKRTQSPMNNKYK